MSLAEEGGSVVTECGFRRVTYRVDDHGVFGGEGGWEASLEGGPFWEHAIWEIVIWEIAIWEIAIS